MLHYYSLILNHIGVVFMTQIAINSVNNKNLFSNYYLDNLIENIPEWKNDDHKDAFQRIKKIYNAESAFLETLNEKQLEQRFFGPIFKILNHTVEVNESTKFQEFPDYALFPNRESLDDAHRNKDFSSFYKNAYAIGEVKRWGIELDRFGKDKNDRKRNPSLQIWIYLHDNAPKWGILSNGAKWRLYNKDRLRDEYFEIDLPTLFATNDIENFRYFYYFFRMEAFLKSHDGDPFLERVLKGSVEYANEIGDDLKENVYRAMKKIGEGFFNWTQNKLDIQDEATREIVQKNTMLLLYRFLFLLYAEGKELLDLGNSLYRDSYSFQRLKKEIKEKHDGPQQNRYQTLSTTLWFRLRDLFRLIDQGSESFGILKSNFYVPAYNGGLFDPEKHPELEKWTIGDSYLAEAIDLLSRSNVNGKLDFVDYSTLEIRHLGSIYEGLLEYKLKVAEEDMVVKNEEWCTLGTYNEKIKQMKGFSDFDDFDKVTKGQLHLATDKGERKSTGSYYTPDYIVNYIVDNTIGPMVEKKWNEAKAKEQSLVDATLSVKVLDPAMGSGHFLVGSIEFLAGKLLLAAQNDIESGMISDDSHFTDDWARREVVSHCIYGVDLNYMAVELAKVSLWLTTISKDKPLSFLDHRLKQGNSLIGAQLMDLPWYPDLNDKTKKRDNTTLQKFEDEVRRPFVDKIVQQLMALSEIDDDTIEHINQKKALFEKLKENKQYLQIKSIADVYTAVYFGNETTEVNKNPKFAYNDLFWALKGDDKEWARKTYKPWFKKAMEIARDKSFFHWELEFPEVFFEAGAPKENPGWDVVVGNPPYIDSEEMAHSWQEVRDYCVKVGYEAASGNWDIFCVFIEKGLLATRDGGLFGQIIPNKLLAADYAAGAQNVISSHTLTKLRDYSRVKVFGASVYPIVVIVDKKIHAAEPIQVEIMGENSDSDNPYVSFINLIDFDVFNKFPEGLWSPLVNRNFHIINKCLKCSDAISPNLATILGAATVSEAYKIKTIVQEATGVLPNSLHFINTGTIDRYDSLWGIKDTTYIKGTYRNPIVKYDDIKAISLKRLNEGTSEKIIVAGMTLRLEAFYDCGNYLAGKSTVIILEKLLDLKFILSCINSKLISFVYRELFESLALQGGYLRIGPPQIERLPIRKIFFTTPANNRIAFVEEAKTLYSDFLGSGNNNNILTFVTSRIEAEPEESDVIHDILAYLAERMINMNQEKNIEVKGFLNWFEGEIGVPVNELINKTAISTYYTHDFETLAKVLAKNKKKLKEGYDPTKRGPKEKIHAEYDTSISKLAPLLENIKATDGLIDAIMYKLYGLTEDEIKIVEGDINGE